jgi:PspA-Associated protein
VIVRIMADNQYRLGDDLTGEIERLDDQLLAALDANDSARFQASLNALVDFVQRNGHLVAPDELVPSDVMVPAGDMTLDEAKAAMQKAAVHDQGGPTS